ncbi:SDR family NAD(P)-dependent oxidoreductase [Nocardioides pacificus]
MTSSAVPPVPSGAPVAVVVGGASGIGRASAVALATEGYRVTVADRDADGAQAVAVSLPDGVGVGVDVSDEAGVEGLFDAVVERCGRLDVVVNTAGYGGLGSVTDLPVEEFRGLIDVNLTGSFLVVKHAARRMTSGGSITLLSSLNARQPAAGMVAYCTSKAGVSMLTEVAALELGPRGIRVNAIAPGLVMTALTEGSMDIPGVREDYVANTPLGRAGAPDEIAEAVVFLARAQWLTGEVLDLNGGAHLLRYPDLLGHVQRMLEA